MLTSSNSTPNRLIVISPYPQPDTTHTEGGLASYTKNSINAIKDRFPNVSITILANEIQHSKKQYSEQNIQVIRCWKRNHLSMYLNLLRRLTQPLQADDVMIEFEFAAYGNFMITAIFPLFLLIAKLLHKKITLVVHQVTTNLSPISTHVGLKHKLIPISFFNLLLTAYYQLLAFGCYQLITLEPALARELKSLIKHPRITSVPHGVIPIKGISKSMACKRLNLNPNFLYVLSFGYISHYKGTDLLVKSFQTPMKVNGKEVKLIIAGGESPTQKHKTHYRHFYHKLAQSINPDTTIQTGFVSDTQVGDYYSIADLVVLPYRTFMSASGPASLALGYGKPLLVSRHLSHLSPFTVTLNSKNIRHTISLCLANPKKLSQLSAHSKTLAKQRDFTIQAETYFNLLLRQLH